MALFRRKKTDMNVLPEMQDYYRAEKRERTSLAWLLTLATLLVVALVIVGLFFGGRFAYRKIRKNDKPTPVEVKPDVAVTTPKPSVSTPPADTPTPPPSDATVQAPTSASGPTPNDRTPAVTSIPNTGPGDTLAVFLAVSVLAYLAHRRYTSSI